jgi:hypothetical protein
MARHERHTAESSIFIQHFDDMRDREMPIDDRRDALTDILTDLRHLAGAYGFDFDKALRLSLMHWEAEGGE